MTAKNVLEPLAWLFQLLSGVALAVLITLHFYVTHMTSHDALSYKEVIARLASFEYKLMYALLLLFVSFHAFNGLRAIILDTNFGAKNRGFVNVLCFALFAIAFLYGLYLLAVIA